MTLGLWDSGLLEVGCLLPRFRQVPSEVHHFPFICYTVKSMVYDHQAPKDVDKPIKMHCFHVAVQKPRGQSDSFLGVNDQQRLSACGNPRIWKERYDEGESVKEYASSPLHRPRRCHFLRSRKAKEFVGTGNQAPSSYLVVLPREIFDGVSLLIP